jgi:hypothetical protein
VADHPPDDRRGPDQPERCESARISGCSPNKLPQALVVTDFAALAAEFEALAPRPIRPRVEAELVRVVSLAGVLSLT